MPQKTRKKHEKSTKKRINRLRRHPTSVDKKLSKPNLSQVFSNGSTRVINVFNKSKPKINVHPRPKLKRQSSSFVEKVKLIAVGKQRSNSGRDLVKSSRKFQTDLSVEEVMERYKLTRRELLQYINEERKKHNNIGNR